MRKHKRILVLWGLASVVALLIGLVGALPAAGAPRWSSGSVNGVAALPQNITYNFYTTDGYVSLADGTVIYNYGFIGGRAGAPLVYQNSMVAPPGAPKTFVPGAIVTLATGAPAPTGGPVTAAELPLAGNAQFPGPMITCAAGDTVTINLKNLGVTNKTAPNDPHSVHLHAVDVDAANDGVPETSVGAVPANLAVPGAGNIVVYMFSPTTAGTYFYHCHQEADIHVQMGMFGALTVYNPGEVGATSGPGGSGILFGWRYDRDVVLLLSEIDTRQHVSEQQGAGGSAAFNPVNYQPQYWCINGLSFPNTIHAAGPAAKGATPFVWGGVAGTLGWIDAHPGYDPLVYGSVGTTSTDGSPGQKVLIRMINMGFETQPMHMHGFHGKVIGSDQRAWPWANTSGTTAWGAGLEKNTITIGSGEEYDWLVNFGLQAVNSTYQAGTQSRYTVANNLPVSNALTANPAIPVPAVVPPVNYIGGPTVAGNSGGLTVQGAAGTAAANSQLFPFHNHDDYKATNNGVYPGGQFTFIVPLP